jgi:hypothetical protein
MNYMASSSFMSARWLRRMNPALQGIFVEQQADGLEAHDAGDCFYWNLDKDM